MKNLILYSFILLGLTSCESFLDNELPSDQVTFEEGIQTEEDLQEMINSIYDVVANSFTGRAQKFAEALGEDVSMVGNTGTLLQVYNRNSDFFNGEVGGIYREPYFVIFRANTLLNEIDKVGVTGASRDRMIGEAKAMRALSHFELVKLFGQPYGYTSDNSHLGIVLRESAVADPGPRNTVGDVYASVLNDLLEARELLPVDNGIYLDKSDAAALLARVYFLQNDFTNAERYARLAIEESGLELGMFNGRYVQDAVPEEALFYIISTGPEDNRSGDWRGVLASDQGIPALRASEEIAFLMTQDPNDQRRSLIDTLVDGGSEVYAFNKFNKIYFNSTLLSLTEMYFIAAESLIEMESDFQTAVDYINAIKTRAGAPSIPNTENKNILLGEVRREKRKEFAGEGINLFDLKRRGAKGENIIIRGAPWDCPGMVLQFPASEITVEGFVLNEEGGCN
jgi:hypothetical protein